MAVRNTQALSGEELAKLRFHAARNGKNPNDMTDEQLREYWDRTHPRGDADDDADAVTGRGGAGDSGDDADADGVGGDAGGEPGDADSDSGDAGDADSDAPPPPPPGADDNALDAHIRVIAREEVDYHAQVMDHGAVDEAKVVALIKKHATRRTSVVVKRPDMPDVTIEDAHQMFAKVLPYIAAKKNVFLVGPAGVGKSTLARQIAEALGKDFHPTGPAQQEYKYMGNMDVTNQIYRETSVYRVFKFGGVCLIDEADGSAAAAFLVLNPILDGQKFVEFPCGVVERHPEAVFIVAANTFGRGADRMFVGRNQLDGASIDRFAFIEVYYDEAKEVVWSGNEQWTRHVQRIRRAVEATKTRLTVSTRAVCDGADMLRQGISQDEVEHAYIWRGLPKAEIQKIRAAM